MNAPVYQGTTWESDRPLRRLAVAATSGLWTLAMRAWRASLRIDQHDVAYLDDYLASGKSVVVVFWHGRYLPLFAALSGRAALVVTSLSFRGAVLAGIAKRFGFRTVQVGGHKDIFSVLLTELARPGGLVAIAADGPLGPPHIVKPGAVVLAARSGAGIIPIQPIARRAIHLRARWDRMSLPLPGTCVKIRVGHAITFASDDIESIDLAAAQVAAALEELDSGRSRQPLPPPDE